MFLSATPLSRGRVLTLRSDNFTSATQRQREETMNSVSAGHIILTSTKNLSKKFAGLRIVLGYYELLTLSFVFVLSLLSLYFHGTDILLTLQWEKTNFLNSSTA